MSTVTTADDIASHVLNKARDASNQGTFAVGGMLFNNKTQEIIKEMHNNVLVPLSNNEIFTQDPTAHGEFQLVYWYYENKDRLHLPEPKDLTIMTSLDPCVMCTGALLTAGFNVGVITIDTFSGINYNSKFDFPDLPDNLKSKLKDKFGYYATGNPAQDPKKYVREYVGSKSLPFNSERVSAQHLMDCDAVFSESVNDVRDISHQKSGKTPDKMRDPATLPDDSIIKTTFRKIYSNSFSIKTSNPRFPNEDIIKELTSVAEGVGNAVSFIDQFGNVVLCLPGEESKSPVRTAFMEVVQNYSKTRWDLMNNDDSREIAENTLTHPKYGTFLFLYAPEPNTAITLMTLGAYGSTMEGSVPQKFPANLQYVYPPQNEGKMLDLISMISKLPPFYTTRVQLSIARTPLYA